MKVTIEHVFCRYSDEATDIYFRIINTILFSIDEAELRASMKHILTIISYSATGHIICGSAKDAPAIRLKFLRTG